MHISHLLSPGANYQQSNWSNSASASSGPSFAYSPRHSLSDGLQHPQDDHFMAGTEQYEPSPEYSGFGSRRTKRPRPTSANMGDDGAAVYAPPAAPAGIPLEIVKALAVQNNLSDERKNMFYSFHRATEKLDKSLAIVQLMAHAVTLSNADKFDRVLEDLHAVQEQVALLSSNANRSFTITEDQRAHFRMLARTVILETDRRQFKDMYSDVMVAVERSAGQLGLTTALQIAGNKKKVITAIKTICNEVREFLRRLIVNSVLDAGPTRCTIDDFCARVLEKMGKDTNIVITRELAGQLALMRAYALELQDKRTPFSVSDVPSDVDEEPASPPASSTTSKGAKKAKDDQSMKFWQGFEKFVSKKMAQGGSKAGYAEVVHRTIEADKIRIPAAPGSSHSMLPPPPSSFGIEAAAASQAVEDFLS